MSRKYKCKFYAVKGIRYINYYFVVRGFQNQEQYGQGDAE